MRPHRADGDLATDVPDYRRMMPYLMRTRTESAVGFEAAFDVGAAEAYLDAYRSEHPDARATLFDVFLYAMARVLHEYPKLNRFVAGGRIYDRRGVWISYSAKRELEEGSPILVLKRRFEPGEPFEAVVADLHGSRAEGRAGGLRTDREAAVLVRLPGPVLRGVMALERRADALGLLPRFFVDGDPFFASAFVANLGSLGMDAAAHHLYEYGTIGIFCSIGRVEPTPGGSRSMRLRYTFDERVEDGIYAGHALERLRSLVEAPIEAGLVTAPTSSVKESSTPSTRRSASGQRSASA